MRVQITFRIYRSRWWVLGSGAGHTRAEEAKSQDNEIRQSFSYRDWGTRQGLAIEEMRREADQLLIDPHN